MNYDPGRLDRQMQDRIVNGIADALDKDTTERAGRGERALTGRDREMLIRDEMGRQFMVINRERIQKNAPPVSEEERAGYERAVMAELLETGAALERWLHDPSWENLDVNGCDQAFVTYADGRTEKVDQLFRDDEEMLEYMGRVARRGNSDVEQRIDPDAPFLSFPIDGGFRFTAVWGGRGKRGLSDRPILSIRQHRMKELLSLEALHRLGSISAGALQTIYGAVLAGLCIAIVGEPNAGKTTMLRAIAMAVPPGERITTIEDAPELQLTHFDRQNVVAYETRKPNSEGRGAFELAELVRISLRTNPGRVLLGEILGPAEAGALLNAMSQGSRGSMCTFHAYDTRDAFDRLISLCAQPPISLNTEAAGRVIGNALDLVIHVQYEQDPLRPNDESKKRRYVSSIREVGSWDNGQITSGEVCAPGPDGLAVPSAAFSSPTIRKRLAAVGYHHQIEERRW